MDKEQLEALYAADGYYWGTEPNELARQTVARLGAAPGARLLDLGAGEGRDGAYFAAAGYAVLAVDVAANGLRKAVKLAAQRGVRLDTLQGDLNTVRVDGPFDVVYSIGALQYVEPARRAERLAHFQAATAPGGWHALFAFVAHPEVPPAPDWGRNEHLFEPGELKAYYGGWSVEFEDLTVFDCTSSGVPRRHAAEVLFARKPGKGRR